MQLKRTKTIVGDDLRIFIASADIIAKPVLAPLAKKIGGGKVVLVYVAARTHKIKVVYKQQTHVSQTAYCKPFRAPPTQP